MISGSGPMMGLPSFTGGGTVICVRLPKGQPAFHPVTRRPFLRPLPTSMATRPIPFGQDCSAMSPQRWNQILPPFWTGPEEWPLLNPR